MNEKSTENGRFRSEGGNPYSNLSNVLQETICILVESEMLSLLHVKLWSRKRSLNPSIFALKFKEGLVTRK